MEPQPPPGLSKMEEVKWKRQQKMKLAFAGHQPAPGGQPLAATHEGAEAPRTDLQDLPPGPPPQAADLHATPAGLRLAKAAAHHATPPEPLQPSLPPGLPPTDLPSAPPPSEKPPPGLSKMEEMKWRRTQKKQAIAANLAAGAARRGRCCHCATLRSALHARSLTPCGWQQNDSVELLHSE
jgi:hypothetical protein